MLEEGLILSNGERRASLLRFDQMETVLPAIEADDDVPIKPMATFPPEALLESMQRDDAPATARWARIELHRRVALGAATLPFGLLAMGLALGRRDLSRSSGTLMGLIGAMDKDLRQKVRAEFSPQDLHRKPHTGAR